MVGCGLQPFAHRNRSGRGFWWRLFRLHTEPPVNQVFSGSLQEPHLKATVNAMPSHRSRLDVTDPFLPLAASNQVIKGHRSRSVPHSITALGNVPPGTLQEPDTPHPAAVAGDGDRRRVFVGWPHLACNLSAAMPSCASRPPAAQLVRPASCTPLPRVSGTCAWKVKNL